jgi:GT2 family glycosyltransferase
MRSRFAVVILNWRGVTDTIACLRSLADSEPDAVPIVIDNGSGDDSLERITHEFSQGERRFVRVGDDSLDVYQLEIATADAVVIGLSSNRGFAAGCNVGLRMAEVAGLDVTVFLNNDTEVADSALSRIVDRVRTDPSVFAAIPMIVVHGTDRIWNCGGSISRLGFRRYYFSDARLASLKPPDEIDCSFFTGCCFAVRTVDFAARHGFTERFFFGEEDFELCLWMKDRGYRALCLTRAVISHKVGASISRAASSRQASKIFVHYLNRFIHMRLRLGGLRWSAWLALYTPYIALLLNRAGIIRASEIPRFLAVCVDRARRRDSVTAAEFASIMETRPW